MFNGWCDNQTKPHMLTPQPIWSLKVNLILCSLQTSIFDIEIKKGIVWVKLLGKNMVNVKLLFAFDT